MVGADVAELRALAAQFSASASRLRQTAQSIRSGVHASPWRGSIADMFRITWDSDHSARLRSAADHLEDAAQNLRRNADQQERASTADNAGPGQAGPSGGPNRHYPGAVGPLIGSILGDMGEILDHGQAAFDLDKLYDALGRPDSETLAKLAKLDFHIGFRQGLKDLFHVGPLGTIGNVLSIGSLISAYAEGDQVGFLKGSVDLVGGAGASMVAGPLGGVAWFVGSQIGTGIYNAGDWVAQQAGLDGLGGIAYREGARVVFGPDVNVQNLTPSQAQALCDRYDGFGGVVNAMTDQAGGLAHEAGHAVSTGVDMAAGAVSGAVDGVAEDVVEFVSHLPKVRLPWEH